MSTSVTTNPSSNLPLGIDDDMGLSKDIKIREQPGGSKTHVFADITVRGKDTTDGKTKSMVITIKIPLHLSGSSNASWAHSMKKAMTTALATHQTALAIFNGSEHFSHSSIQRTTGFAAVQAFFSKDTQIKADVDSDGDVTMRAGKQQGGLGNSHLTTLTRTNTPQAKPLTEKIKAVLTGSKAAVTSKRVNNAAVVLRGAHVGAGARLTHVLLSDAVKTGGTITATDIESAALANILPKDVRDADCPTAKEISGAYYLIKPKIDAKIAELDAQCEALTSKITETSSGVSPLSPETEQTVLRALQSLQHDKGIYKSLQHDFMTASIGYAKAERAIDALNSMPEFRVGGEQQPELLIAAKGEHDKHQTGFYDALARYETTFPDLVSGGTGADSKTDTLIRLLTTNPFRESALVKRSKTYEGKLSDKELKGIEHARSNSIARKPIDDPKDILDAARALTRGLSDKGFRDKLVASNNDLKKLIVHGDDLFQAGHALLSFTLTANTSDQADALVTDIGPLAIEAQDTGSADAADGSTDRSDVTSSPFTPHSTAIDDDNDDDGEEGSDSSGAPAGTLTTTPVPLAPSTGDVAIDTPAGGERAVDDTDSALTTPLPPAGVAAPGVPTTPVAVPITAGGSLAGSVAPPPSQAFPSKPIVASRPEPIELDIKQQAAIGKLVSGGVCDRSGKITDKGAAALHNEMRKLADKLEIRADTNEAINRFLQPIKTASDIRGISRSDMLAFLSEVTIRQAALSKIQKEVDTLLIPRPVSAAVRAPGVGTPLPSLETAEKQLKRTADAIGLTQLSEHPADSAEAFAREKTKELFANSIGVAVKLIEGNVDLAEDSYKEPDIREKGASILRNAGIPTDHLPEIHERCGVNNIAQLSNLDTRRDTTRSDLTRLIATEEASITLQETEIDKHSAQIHKVEQEIEAYRIELQAIPGEIISIEQKITGITRNLTTKEAKHQQLVAAQAKINAAAPPSPGAKPGAKISAAVARFSANAGMKLTLPSRETLTKEIDRLDEQRAVLAGEKGKLEQRKAALPNLIEQLEQDISASTQERDALLPDLGETKKKLAVLTYCLTTLDANFAALQAQINDDFVAASKELLTQLHIYPEGTEEQTSGDSLGIIAALGYSSSSIGLPGNDDLHERLANAMLSGTPESLKSLSETERECLELLRSDINELHQQISTRPDLTAASEPVALPVGAAAGRSDTIPPRETIEAYRTFLNLIPAPLPRAAGLETGRGAATLGPPTGAASASVLRR